MRIVDEIPHPQYKITVFSHNNRFSVQIESDLLTQLYKFRENEELMTGKEFRNLFNQPLIEQLTGEFHRMEIIRKNMEQVLFKPEEDPGFPKIV